MKKLITLLLLSLSLLTPSASATLYESAEPPFAVMYHRVSDTEFQDAFTISTAAFEADIRFLKNNGYTFCTANEFDEKLKKKENGKFVAITFDDGYSGYLENVLPVLEKYDANATFFIIGELVGSEGYMTRDEIKQLSESKLVQIGNHSYFLHNIGYKNVSNFYFGTDCKAAFEDYGMNKTMLENITGKKVTAVSYPYGIFGRYIDHMLKQDGNVTFCSEEKPAKPSQPYGRYNRSADTDIEKIIAKLH